MRIVPATIIFCLLSVATPALAQDAPCGLRTMSESAIPVYPPIAKAAHVVGNVIMLATFQTSGEVEKVDVISGPEMLRASATTYVQSWRANEYTGPRTCPVIVQYTLTDNGPSQAVKRFDLQHVTLYAQVLCLCDPPFTISKRKKHLLFF